MSGSHRKAGAGSYRDKVTELIAQGATLGDVEGELHARAELTKDETAALWLFAFSLRDRAEQENDAEAYLTTVEVAAQTTDCAARARSMPTASPCRRAIEAFSSEWLGCGTPSRHLALRLAPG